MCSGEFRASSGPMLEAMKVASIRGSRLRMAWRYRNSPARVALDVEDVDLLVHDPDAALDPVVGHRDFIVEGLDADGDSGGPLLVDIDPEINVLELEPALEADGALGDLAPVEADREPGGAALVAFRLQGHPHRQPGHRKRRPPA